MPRKIYKWNETTAIRVEALAQYGVPHDMIAIDVGMAEMTLQKIYKKELHLGKIKANTKVAKRLFEKCMAGDTASLLFWCKTRMGWRERDKQVADAEKLQNSQGGKAVLIEAMKEAFKSVGN